MLLFPVLSPKTRACSFAVGRVKRHKLLYTTVDEKSIMAENGDAFRVEKNDAISFLQIFEDKTVDTIITDPPYCSYGVGSSANKYSAKCSADASSKSCEYECGKDILFDNKDFFSNFMFFKVWATECL